jgi:hypothetical protein
MSLPHIARTVYRHQLSGEIATSAMAWSPITQAAQDETG